MVQEQSPTIPVPCVWSCRCSQLLVGCRKGHQGCQLLLPAVFPGGSSVLYLHKLLLKKYLSIKMFSLTDLVTKSICIYDCWKGMEGLYLNEGMGWISLQVLRKRDDFITLDFFFFNSCSRKSSLYVPSCFFLLSFLKGQASSSIQNEIQG